jgi:hypothetical protein
MQRAWACGPRGSSRQLENLEKWASYTNSVDFYDVTDKGENAMVTAHRELAK